MQGTREQYWGGNITRTSTTTHTYTTEYFRRYIYTDIHTVKYTVFLLSWKKISLGADCLGSGSGNSAPSHPPSIYTLIQSTYTYKKKRELTCRDPPLCPPALKILLLSSTYSVKTQSRGMQSRCVYLSCLVGLYANYLIYPSILYNLLLDILCQLSYLYYPCKVQTRMGYSLVGSRLLTLEQECGRLRTEEPTES